MCGQLERKSWKVAVSAVAGPHPPVQPGCPQRHAPVEKPRLCENGGAGGAWGVTSNLPKDCVTFTSGNQVLTPLQQRSVQHPLPSEDTGLDPPAPHPGHFTKGPCLKPEVGAHSYATSKLQTGKGSSRRRLKKRGCGQTSFAPRFPGSRPLVAGPTASSICIMALSSTCLRLGKARSPGPLPGQCQRS